MNEADYYKILGISRNVTRMILSRHTENWQCCIILTEHRLT
ncbi:MAG: hypothetical protein QMD06_02500 [Candidatus Altarchaeum sp.]|nr:hypothetical protein [Candidatus Altarchaeum sp.]